MTRPPTRHRQLARATPLLVAALTLAPLLEAQTPPSATTPLDACARQLSQSNEATATLEKRARQLVTASEALRASRRALAALGGDAIAQVVSDSAPLSRKLAARRDAARDSVARHEQRVRTRATLKELLSAQGDALGGALEKAAALSRLRQQLLKNLVAAEKQAGRPALDKIGAPTNAAIAKSQEQLGAQQQSWRTERAQLKQESAALGALNTEEPEKKRALEGALEDLQLRLGQALTREQLERELAPLEPDQLRARKARQEASWSALRDPFEETIGAWKKARAALTELGQRRSKLAAPKPTKPAQGEPDDPIASRRAQLAYQSELCRLLTEEAAAASALVPLNAELAEAIPALTTEGNALSTVRAALARLEQTPSSTTNRDPEPARTLAELGEVRRQSAELATTLPERQKDLEARTLEARALLVEQRAEVEAQQKAAARKEAARSALDDSDAELAEKFVALQKEMTESQGAAKRARARRDEATANLTRLDESLTQLEDPLSGLYSPNEAKARDALLNSFARSAKLSAPTSAEPPQSAPLANSKSSPSEAVERSAARDLLETLKAAESKIGQHERYLKALSKDLEARLAAEQSKRQSDDELSTLKRERAARLKERASYARELLARGRDPERRARFPARLIEAARAALESPPPPSAEGATIASPTSTTKSAQEVVDATLARSARALSELRGSQRAPIGAMVKELHTREGYLGEAREKLDKLSEFERKGLKSESEQTMGEQDSLVEWLSSFVRSPRARDFDERIAELYERITARQSQSALYRKARTLTRSLLDSAKVESATLDAKIGTVSAHISALELREEAASLRARTTADPSLATELAAAWKQQHSSSLDLTMRGDGQDKRAEQLTRRVFELYGCQRDTRAYRALRQTWQEQQGLEAAAVVRRTSVSDLEAYETQLRDLHLANQTELNAIATLRKRRLDERFKAFRASLGSMLLIPLLAWLVIALAGAGARRVVARLRLGIQPDDSSRHREQRMETVLRVFLTAWKAIVIVVASIVLLSEFGVDIRPIVASAGVVGLAVAFGAQSLVRDFFTGFFILLENQYKIGDYVTIGSVEGTVENLSLRLTVLRDPEGNLHFIPNSQVDMVTNFTHGWSGLNVHVTVAYEEPIEGVLALISKVCADIYADEVWSEVFSEQPIVRGVQRFDDHGVTIRTVLRTGAGQQWSAAREFRKRLKIAFDRKSIRLAYPQRVVHMRQDPPRPQELDQQ